MQGRHQLRRRFLQPLIQQIGKQPVITVPKPLVIQGHADETVDWQHNMSVLDSLTQPTYLQIPEARHHLVNESELIRQQILRGMEGLPDLEAAIEICPDRRRAIQHLLNLAALRALIFIKGHSLNLRKNFQTSPDRTE